LIKASKRVLIVLALAVILVLSVACRHGHRPTRFLVIRISILNSSMLTVTAMLTNTAKLTNIVMD